MGDSIDNHQETSEEEPSVVQSSPSVMESKETEVIDTTMTHVSQTTPKDWIKSLDTPHRLAALAVSDPSFLLTLGRVAASLSRDDLGGKRSTEGRSSKGQYSFYAPRGPH